MTLVIHRLMNMVTLPIGINVFAKRRPQFNGDRYLCQGAIHPRQRPHRVMATDQELIEGQAHHLLRYRRELVMSKS